MSDRADSADTSQSWATWLHRRLTPLRAAPEPLRTPNSNAEIKDIQRPNFMGFLNDDCWKIVLDQVSIKDVVSVGQVCKQWQDVVQRYLIGVPFRVETVTINWDADEQSRRRKSKILSIKEKDDRVNFNTVRNKLGRSVVDLVYDAKFANEQILRNLGAKCPNIQDITFVRLQWKQGSCNWAGNFSKLERLCFEDCSITDECVGELIKNNNIKELVLRKSHFVTGSFLLAGVADKYSGDLTNLNTLILSECSNLYSKHLKSAITPAVQAVPYLVRVKRLELRDLSCDIYQSAGYILSKMPQLEHVAINCRGDWLPENVIQTILLLTRLKHLDWFNEIVYSKNESEAALRRPRSSLYQYRITPSGLSGVERQRLQKRMELVLRQRRRQEVERSGYDPDQFVELLVHGRRTLFPRCLTNQVPEEKLYELLREITAIIEKYAK